MNCPFCHRHGWSDPTEQSTPMHYRHDLHCKLLEYYSIAHDSGYTKATLDLFETLKQLLGTAYSSNEYQYLFAVQPGRLRYHSMLATKNGDHGSETNSSVKMPTWHDLLSSGSSVANHDAILTYAKRYIRGIILKSLPHQDFFEVLVQCITNDEITHMLTQVIEKNECIDPVKSEALQIATSCTLTQKAMCSLYRVENQEHRENSALLLATLLASHPEEKPQLLTSEEKDWKTVSLYDLMNDPVETTKNHKEFKKYAKKVIALLERIEAYFKAFIDTYEEDRHKKTQSLFKELRTKVIESKKNFKPETDSAPMCSVM